MKKRPMRFVAYYYFISWGHALNLGLHLSFAGPHLELHVPFGFVRLGWFDGYGAKCSPRTFGYQPV